MRHFAGFQRLAVALPLCGLAVVACGGGGGGGDGSSADTLYVRRNGNDSNSGESPDEAIRSIWKAVSNARAGQTIIVGPGEYTVPRGAPFNSIDVNDIAGDTLTIKADRQGSMTNDRPGDVVINARSGFGMRISRSSNISIEGFRFERARGGQENAAIQIRSGSSDVTIRDCEFNLNRDGVRIEGSSDVTIFNNLFYDNNRAIRLNGSSDVGIFNNTIADNGARGISLGGAPRTSVRNNILQDNSNRNIEADSGSADTYDGDFNLIFSTQRNTDPEDTVAPSTLIGDNVVGAQALFVNPGRGDYHLSAESPAIDSGDNSIDSIDALLLLALLDLSTTPDGEDDALPVDLGYHFPEALEN